jgi:ABC-2 type transport system permease protein
MNSIRSEIRKLTTLRVPWVALAAAVVVAGALGVTNVHVMADETRVTLSDIAVAVAEPAWFLVVVVAVLAAASEFQHRTVLTTLLSTPGRPAALAAKAAASAVFGAVLTAAAVVAAVVAGAATAIIEDLPLHLGSLAELSGSALGAVALGAVWAVVATSLGLLTRSTALALTTVLLWKFVLEGIVPIVLRNPELNRWMPSGASAAVIGAEGSDMPALLGAVVVLGYAAALAALAAISFVRRDPV